LQTEKDYPYKVSDDLNCHYDDTKMVANVTSFETIPSDEKVMAQKLFDKGPLSVAINS